MERAPVANRRHSRLPAGATWAGGLGGLLAEGRAAVLRPLKLLHSGSNLTIVLRMGQPEQSVQLTPVQVHDLNQKLSTFRHNVNNHLSLMIAAIELMKRKPEMAARLVETLAEQPEKISCEMRVFSDEFDKALGIARS